MKPIDQTRLGETGNCYCASLASILEVPLEVMPDITAETMNGRQWHDYIQAYLFRHHGLMAIDLDGRLLPFVTPNGFHIISGESSRGFGHAVVGYRGEICHDPHPSRTALKKVLDYTFLVPVNLESLEDEAHREALKRFLTKAPCICPACQAVEATPGAQR